MLADRCAKLDHILDYEALYMIWSRKTIDVSSGDHATHQCTCLEHTSETAVSFWTDVFAYLLLCTGHRLETDGPLVSCAHAGSH